MPKIIECVPNISEGRDSAKIETILGAIRETPGCTLLDYSSDTSHNRTVITYIGAADSVGEAAVKLAVRAAELIDLTRHTGEHPRMGAVDVIPFIPFGEATIDDCVAVAKTVGERIASEAGMPVFLYERSACAPHRENLAAIRKGQFEGMAAKVTEPEWEPDFGGRRIHPTAGVVAVGARMPLVAFNINLDTADVGIANAISKIIRRSSGGYDCVKALGVELAHRGIAQVSINMTDTRKTPLYRVLETVRFEAARYGVRVTGTEIVGLTPMSALVDSAEYYLQIEQFDGARQVIENHLL